MKVLTAGIIIFICVCSYNNAVGAGLGEFCTEDGNCTETGQKCADNGTCVCYTNNHYIYDESKCVKELGRSCTTSSDCNDAAVICDNQVCKCITATYYDNNGNGTMGGSCVARHDFGATCTDPTSGAGDNQCSTANAFCKADTGSSNPITYSCQCGDGSVQDGESCVTVRYLEDSCTVHSECAKVDNSECRNSKCQCLDGYYQDGTGSTGTCSRRSLGQTCTEVSQCDADNTQCTESSGTKTCSCETGFYPDNNSCLKRSLGETCTDVSQCTAQGNVQCTGSLETKKCSCQTGFYSDSNNCQKRYLGESCSDNTHCSLVIYGKCSSSTCACQNGYYQLGSGMTGVCTKRYLDESCNTNSDCSLVTFGECRGSTCSCLSGYFQSGTGSSGTCSKRSLGQTCTEVSQCDADNTQCTESSGTKTCSCETGFYPDNNSCLKRSLGQTCTEVSQCEADNTQCTESSGTKTCSCQTGFYPDSNNCLKRVLGQSCDATSQCSAASAVCSGGRCQCPSAYYDTTGSTTGGSCKLKVSLGGTCPQPTNDVPNTATCSDTNARCTGSGSSYTCQCISTYYDNMDSRDRKCVQKVGLGNSCPQLDACGTSNADCVGEKCICNSQYYDDNGSTNYGGNCRLRISLEARCNGNPPANLKQCSDPSATCTQSSGSYKCTCNTGFHREGSECVANKPLGETCSVPTDCSDPAANCSNSKCTCGHNYYDDNGFTQGGTCSPMTNLQVTNINFPSSSVKTNEITVTWSAPVYYKQFIDQYSVQWKRTYGSSIAVQSENVASSETSLSLTLTKGIESGRAYTVTIISINDRTQTSSERTISVAKQQAAKPAVTSGLDWPNSDQDATGTIKVAWNAAAGYVSRYYVQLLDGTTMIMSKTVLSSDTHAEFTSSGLKDGYRYNVNITARSESYDSGKRVPGETFTAVFKTTPKTPDPPQNGFCKDPTDKSITLKWSKPADTKGDLVKYHIYVYQNSNTLKFIVSTTGTETQEIVGNLDPGTSYTFRIYTENEMYNSSSSNNVTTGCKTKAKMSEAPTNLDITNVTSRSFDISWMKPTETYSAENYGYVLQIKDDQDVCVKEMIYRCSDCDGMFQVSNLNGLCDSTVQTIDKTKQELEGQLTYSASLNPDIAYTVTVTAINDAGRGYAANETERTKEEAPQKPDNVMMEDVMAKSVKVTWNIADPRPGKTTYKITLDAQAPADDKVIVVEGFENRSFTFSNLEEFWKYQVTVNASTAIGSNISDVKEIKTLPAAPGNVLSFRPINAPSDNYRKLKIVWKAPELLERNSIITNYSFRHNTTGVFQTEMLNQETDFTHEYSVMVDVVPEEYYSFEVFAINEQNENGSVSYLNKQAVAGVPKNIENTTQIKVIPKEKVKDVQQTQFTVTFVQEFFEQSENGQIRATGLVACVESKCSTSNIEDLSDFNNMDTWKEASKGTYRVTDESWLEEIKAKSAGPNARRKRDVTSLEYTVGSENCASVDTDEYCNGQLEPNTRYMLFAVACTNGGCLVSQPYGPFITLAVPDEDNNLMIIGIVVAVGVVVLIGAVVGFILLRRRKSGPGKMKPVSESDDEDFTTIDPAVAKIQRKRPILLNEIEEYVNKMHKDSNLLFSAEYEDLKTLSPKHACEAADREENRMRNRYINIIPFDHTRVKLSTNGEDDSSDYINANYLPGYSSPREYIGCQGPIPGTIDDFWRMTWEQNVSVVVMLTLCKEGQKIKCEQYWPDEVGEPKQYGDVIVEITSYSNIRTYDYRMFKITNGSTTRVVKHFHFLSWLDFQANVHHDIILDFIEHVRQHVQPPDTSGPMIIHCSAGVGRTGTYIALDHLMQFINEHDFDVSIDIFDLVLKLRENRQHMVQTEQQYVFIHDCVKEIMDRKRRQMENIYENQAFLEKLNAAQDENIYQNEQSLYENVSQAKSEQNTEL